MSFAIVVAGISRFFMRRQRLTDRFYKGVRFGFSQAFSPRQRSCHEVILFEKELQFTMQNSFFQLRLCNTRFYCRVVFRFSQTSVLSVPAATQDKRGSCRHR
jgi:hypothetical protein